MTESESVVLPLDDGASGSGRARIAACSGRGRASSFVQRSGQPRVCPRHLPRFGFAASVGDKSPCTRVCTGGKRKLRSMADHPPPDTKRGHGTKRGGKSGKVADFRYKRPSRPDGKRGERRNASRRAGKPVSRGPVPAVPPGPGTHRQAYAALDLGTNNCRLLIARPSGENFMVIDAFSRVRLGEGLAASGKLSDEAMERTMAALHVCAEKLRRRNVRLARSVATEACRRRLERPRLHRARAPRNGDHARYHLGAGRGAAGGAGLSHPARGGRRPRDHLRHRRRLDRAGWSNRATRSPGSSTG